MFQWHNLGRFAAVCAAFSLSYTPKTAEPESRVNRAPVSCGTEKTSRYAPEWGEGLFLHHTV
jgi:hypothetical protein